MSWRDRLLPASFRGVAFHVARHNAGSGRRLVPHEYPGEDKPYTEDLGKRASTYQVDGYLVGDDYATVRDALTRACNEKGRGTLVHPYLGRLDVKCESIDVSERTDEGRMARVSMRFIEAGENTYPSVRLDTASRSMALRETRAQRHAINCRPGGSGSNDRAALRAGRHRGRDCGGRQRHRR